MPIPPWLDRLHGALSGVRWWQADNLVEVPAEWSALDADAWSRVLDGWYEALAAACPDDELTLEGIRWGRWPANIAIGAVERARAEALGKHWLTWSLSERAYADDVRDALQADLMARLVELVERELP